LILTVAGALLFCLAAPGTGETASAEAPVSAPGEAPVRARFADLSPEHWVWGSVEALAEAGVVAGSDDGLFHPDRPAIRAEMFKMILLARGVHIGSGCEGRFRDVPCAAWHAPVVEMAWRLALTEGKSDRLVAPDDPVTREELFTVVNRALGRHLQADRMVWRVREERMAWFTDGHAIAAWARAPVALMVADGLILGYGDGSFRPQVLATRAEVAELVRRALLRPSGEVAVVDGAPVRHRQALQMVASMYATGEPGVGTITFSGLPVRIGVVATDPAVIPLGTLLYVEGYGYAVAADTGGAIKGHRIDLFTDNFRQASIEFGIQRRMVYILP
jgi:3D (Asp-Asp-Asp) domain-containing protein